MNKLYTKLALFTSFEFSIKFLLIRFVFYIPHVLQRTYLALYQFYSHNVHRSFPAS